MSTIAFPALILFATFGFLIVSRRRLNQQLAHLQVGAVTARLGLQLIEGAPAHNLATQSVQPEAQNLGSARGFLKQMAATQVGGTLGETKIYAVGRPHGLQAELMLYCRQHLQPGFDSLTTTTWHDLRLTVHAPHALPAFDLRLRHETPGLPTRRGPDGLALPERRLPDPALAERYLLTTADPTLPVRIASALAALQLLSYVHITGSGNQVSFAMTPISVMSSASAFEQILHALTQIAAALSGAAHARPAAPAR